MKRIFFYALCLLSFIHTAFAIESYEVKKLTFLEVNASINPATYNYLETNFKKLSGKNGDLVFIKLDTPGGLVTTTKDILTLIGSVDFPVGVWITPEGASATSAGAIIASGAHLLVMSKGTNIGAATPINMSEDIKQKDAKTKAVNDLVALVRSLSKARGRDATQFEKMISEAKSLDAEEALKLKVVDHLVDSQLQLTQKINGQKIRIIGKEYQLKVDYNVSVTYNDMDPGQLILNIFANPTTAYVLFIIGAALIYFELQAPGGFIAGGIGVVFLFLAGIGFQVLPLNLGAMGLIVLSFILFVLEVYITSFGILTLGGLASLIIGSLFLFRTENSFIELEMTVIFSVVSAVALYVGFMGWFFIKTYRKHKNFYSNAGEKGVVSQYIKEKADGHHYQVKVHGEIWNAISQEKLEVGDNVDITRSNEEQLILSIKKA